MYFLVVIIGEILHLYSRIHGSTTILELAPPHHYDPESSRFTLRMSQTVTHARAGLEVVAVILSHVRRRLEFDPLASPTLRPDKLVCKEHISLPLLGGKTPSKTPDQLIT